MQQSDERRRTGRPSLLSEQPPTAETQSILNKLDGRASPARPAKVRRRSRVLPVVAAAAVLGAGALAWLTGADGMAERPVVAAAVVAPPVAAPALPAAPVAAAPAIVLADPEPEVSAATILDEVPHAAAPAKPAAKDELTELLDKPATVAEAAAPVVAKAAAKESAAEAAKPAVKEPPKQVARTKSEPVKVARKDKPRDKDAKPALAAARKKTPAAKPEPKVDSDVALLAALLAHSKASSAPRLSKTATEYKRCGTLPSVAEADKCRERLCESGAKVKAECKSLRVAKVSS